MLKIESLESDEKFLSESDLGETEGGFSGGQDEQDDECAGSAIWDRLLNDDTMTVTQLTGGVRNPNRVNVFLDGHFAFSLDMAQVVDLQVKVGQKLKPERVAELQAASEFGKLYQRTLEWVLTRPHSVREARDYLKRRQIKRMQLNRQRAREEKRPLPEFQNETIDLVVKRLVEKGYLDDRKFARFYVENRNVRKGISQKRLRMELKKKGVSEADIASILTEDLRDDKEELMKMIMRKRRRYNDLQMVNYLVRQGFDFQTAKAAVAEYDEAKNNDSCD